MRIITSVARVRTEGRRQGKLRVLVPTMGALHAGHVSLIQLARQQAGAEGEVVVSIFVNPLQFEPGSDFERYPRPDVEDEKICRSEGVHFIFRPPASEMYLEDRSVCVEETMLSERLCGASRPGHFTGVCTVVTKLFHLLNPAVAVFGEKDFQQLAIMRRMVRDLNFPVEIVAGSTVREADGLALSSRNRYLSAEEREQAPIVRQALLEAQQSKAESARNLVAEVREKIESAPLARVDYVELVGVDDLQPRLTTDPPALLAAAVFFGQTRLIDNIVRQ